MKYLEFFIRLLAFAVTLFLLLEFMVACDMDTWKAAAIFTIASLSVISLFFLTKQHLVITCKHCSSKISPVKNTVSNMFKKKT